MAIGKTKVKRAPYRIPDTNKPRCFLDFRIPALGIDDLHLRLESFKGQESISQPFEYHLGLKANDDPAIGELELDFSRIVGQKGVVRIGLPAKDHPYWTEDEWREPEWNFTWFWGVVSQITMAEPGVYQVTLKPTLWKLTLANQYKIYGQGDQGSISIKQAIESVLRRHGVEYEMIVTEKRNPGLALRQNWLQAGESDYDFMVRLMNKAFLFYYFKQTEDNHLLVISDRASYEPIRNEEGDPQVLRYTYTRDDNGALDPDDLIIDYSYQQNLATTGVRCTLIRTQAAWEENTIAEFAAYSGQKTDPAADPNLHFHRYQVWQYGGSDMEAGIDARKTYETIATAATGLSGQSTCPLLKPGFTFSAINDPEDAKRPELERDAFVVTRVQHQVSDSGRYRNSFEATEAGGLLAEFQLGNTHQGQIVAKVCKPRKAPPPDWRYYPKNSFHWDTHTCRDTDGGETLNAKGVYVTLSTDPRQKPVWVKLSQQTQTVPECGATVLISRSSDESEVPEVQGMIQANGSEVAFVEPKQWTANTQVGNSHSTNYGDSKSIRYGKKSGVDLEAAVARITAAYDEGKYRDASYSKGGSYSFSESDQGETGWLSHGESWGETYSESHGNSESKTYSKIQKSYSEIGRQTSESKIDSTFSESTIGESESYSTITGKSYSKSTIGESESHSEVKGDSISTSRVGGDSTSESVVDGKSKNVSTVNGKSESHSTVNGKSESHSTVNSDSESHSAVKGNSSNFSRTIGNSMNNSFTLGFSLNNSITIGATMNNSMSLGATSNNSVTLGATSNNSFTGSISMNNSLTVGAAMNNSLTLGPTMNNSITGGANTNISITGMSTDISVTGISVRMAATGISLEIINTHLDLKAPTMEAKSNGGGVMEADAGPIKAII